MIEYAKATPDDIVIRIEAFNRGPDAAPLHILPQLWFRNTWAWGPAPSRPSPRSAAGPRALTVPAWSPTTAGVATLATVPIVYRLGRRTLDAPAGGQLLFTDNETNCSRVFGRGHPHPQAIRQGRVSPLHHSGRAVHQPARDRNQGRAPLPVRRRRRRAARRSLRLRLSDRAAEQASRSLWWTRSSPRERPRPTSSTARSIRAGPATTSGASSGRRWPACSGASRVISSMSTHGSKAMIRLVPTARAAQRTCRNQHWRHLNSLRVMSVPDKWEYPWFAAWDLAFHCVGYALVDPAYAMDQLWLLLFEQFQHPNGQIPAYEWEFSDTNPPVHAWAVWRVYNMARVAHRPGRPPVPRALLPQAADQLRVVGQQGRPARATTFSRAGSSASITSP